MSTATPTLIPRGPMFPNVLPVPPQPHPIPLAPFGYPPHRLARRRDLHREMNDFSEEEQEMEDLNDDIKHRGENFLIPIGRLMTRQEEKNDADEAEEDDDGDGSHSSSASSEPSEVAPSEEDNESEQDLDAEMEDMDDDGNITAETTESNDMDNEESD